MFTSSVKLDVLGELREVDAVLPIDALKKALDASLREYCRGIVTSKD